MKASPNSNINNQQVSLIPQWPTSLSSRRDKSTTEGSTTLSMQRDLRHCLRDDAEYSDYGSLSVFTESREADGE